MIALAWHTARGRASSLAGSFIALALGVALLSALALTLASSVGAEGHPRWFTRPDVVIAGADTVSVSSGGDINSARTSESRAVPAALAGRLAALDATEVLDYAACATAHGAPGRTLHPWSAAGLHGFRWLSCGPLVAASQVALTAPTGFRPGNRITIQTALGPRTFTVSGVISTGAQAAFYGTDAVAAELAGGRIDAVALTARSGEPAAALAGQVRAAARGTAVRILRPAQDGLRDTAAGAQAGARRSAGRGRARLAGRRGARHGDRTAVRPLAGARPAGSGQLLRALHPVAGRGRVRCRAADRDARRPARGPAGRAGAAGRGSPRIGHAGRVDAADPLAGRADRAGRSRDADAGPGRHPFW